jgi:3'-phosphoadenosine 5'-phosphosulfate (PAPS) 3'-phosphatase
MSIVTAVQDDHEVQALYGPDGLMDPDTIKGTPEFLRKTSQFAEVMALAGPGDAEASLLWRRVSKRVACRAERKAGWFTNTILES